jgi:[ribosomal protein S5]-alanine N-acetyltransferase
MQRIVRRVLGELDAGTAMPWTIVRDGAAVGLLGIMNIDRDNALAHVAYELHAAHRGHGIMLEALHRLVDHAFGELKLHRLEAHIDPRNHPSIRLAEASGFVREGVLRANHLFDGRFYDTAVYGRCVDD